MLIARAMRKHGVENFLISLLEECPTAQEAYQREQHWVLVLRANDLCHGYNLTAGGEGLTGKPMSEATKRKLREANLGKPKSEETRRRIGLAGRGRQVSGETREKLRIARLGKKSSEETRRKIREIWQVRRGKVTS
jgi:group I intron endonuclease